MNRIRNAQSSMRHIGHEWRQMPLAFTYNATNRVRALLAINNPNAVKIHKLLVRWSDVYGSVNIQVNDTGMCLENIDISLTDLRKIDIASPGDIQKSEDATKIDGSSTKILFNEPYGNLLTIETWMKLYDNIPGYGSEKAQNFLQLLGHDVGVQGCNYWTHESIKPETHGSAHWMFSINTRPTRSARLSSTLGDNNLRINNFGDDYIFFKYLSIGGLGFARTNA